ncbi:MAG: ribonucleotide-diphosphate reductase subunit beta [Actinobacteria bacterium]|nr:ribonucleotide-diphosphate reductase subunit beta [Actinomycetota bacterium]
MSATTAPIAPQATLPADQIDFVDLYRRWEHNNWSAMDLDFSQDKVDWNEKFDDFMRKAARWNYSLFFFGEDEVADNLSPFIDAAPLEEQKYFITTQQVDEARHAIFFSRFFNEVIGVNAKSYAESLASTQPDLTYGLRKVFETLNRVTDELRRDRSIPKLSQAITLYHLVVEGTLAQTGQHFIADYLTRMDVLPGFREGMVNVEKDEQRHIAAGVKMLADFNRQDDEVRPAMREILQEVLPYTIAVFRPPNDDERYVTVFGETLQNIAVTGQRQLDTRLNAAGIPSRGPEGVLPFMDEDITYEERADRSFVMMRAGLFSGGTEPIKNDPQAIGYFFDLMSASVNPNHGFKEAKVLQWDFTDADPWHIRIDNGTSEAAAGRAPVADVTFTTSLADWMAIIDGRKPIAKALLTRKLKAKGDVKTMLALPRVFVR